MYVRPPARAQILNLDHYLEVLVRKPEALPDATALMQARAAGTFTATHEAFWAAARKAHGHSGGTRTLVEVLLLHRHHNHADVVAGITAALLVGAVSPDVVALETRKHTPGDRGGSSCRPVGVSLAERRLTDIGESLPPDLRPRRRSPPTTPCSPERGTHDLGHDPAFERGSPTQRPSHRRRDRQLHPAAAAPHVP